MTEKDHILQEKRKSGQEEGKKGHVLSTENSPVMNVCGSDKIDDIHRDSRGILSTPTVVGSSREKRCMSTTLNRLLLNIHRCFSPLNSFEDL